MTYRPVFTPATGFAGPSCSSFPPKRRAERLGGSPRPRRHVCWHMAPHAFFKAHGSVCLWKSTRQGCFSAATTEAGKRLRSARDGLIGLQLPAGPRPWPLDGMLGSPHCWVLGPPTSSAGHRPFTSLHGARHLGHAALHERPAHATGPSHPAPRRRWDRRAS